jgi:16S rRNA (cytosine967-C5)-methyltransferase
MVTTRRRAVVSPVRRLPVRSARDLAVSILVRVEGGGFTNLLLHHELARANLLPADSGLVSELVLGTLRHQGRLDWSLTGVLSGRLGELPPPIRAILRTAAYQLLFLSRIPAHAAVNEAVSLARRYGHSGTAKLTNAVLRRLAREGQRALPDPVADPGSHLAVRHSHPLWLVERWLRRWGMQDTEELCAANNAPAPWTARVNVLKSSIDVVTNELVSSGIRVNATVLPEGLEVSGAFDERQRHVREGLLTVQDVGAMLVTHALDPQPGETIIDACAAPGGKTTHVAERMRNRGQIIACDVHERKLQALSRRAELMGVSIIQVHHSDARSLGDAFNARADRLLVDAPCTGLGVVRRRPEIKWRVTPEQIPVCARLQRSILEGSCGSVRPGGVLVYSVCTTEPEEGTAVVESFLAAHIEFRLDDVTWPVGLGLPDAPSALLLPHSHKTDGFFIARLRRTGNAHP